MRTRQAPADVGVRTTLDQDVWWTDIHGITHLIDDMNPSYRANCAALLVKNAAYYHYRKRWLELWLFPIGGDYGRVPDDIEPYTDEQIRAVIRKEQDAGLHLDWMRASRLFQRLIRDIDRLPPGTLPVALPDELYGGDW